MPDKIADDDATIILSAYAERVRETFKVFAENLATGQSEAACKENFRRALLLMRKTRDMALQAASPEGLVGPKAETRTLAEEAAEPLSAEDQALVDSALAGTTGHAPAPPPAPRYRG